MLIKIGSVYQTQDGRKVEIIGLSEYHEFVGTSNDSSSPIYYDNSGTPIDLMTGDRVPNNPLTLVKELSI